MNSGRKKNHGQRPCAQGAVARRFLLSWEVLFALLKTTNCKLNTHSQFEYNGRFLRATKHEPRATSHNFFHEPMVARGDEKSPSRCGRREGLFHLSDSLQDGMIEFDDLRFFYITGVTRRAGIGHG